MQINYKEIKRHYSCSKKRNDIEKEKKRKMLFPIASWSWCSNGEEDKLDDLHYTILDKQKQNKKQTKWVLKNQLLYKRKN